MKSYAAIKLGYVDEATFERVVDPANACSLMAYRGGDHLSVIPASFEAWEFSNGARYLRQLTLSFSGEIEREGQRALSLPRLCGYTADHSPLTTSSGQRMRQQEIRSLAPALYLSDLLMKVQPQAHLHHLARNRLQPPKPP